MSILAALSDVAALCEIYGIFEETRGIFGASIGNL
jgi:hypothetical protein